MDIEPRSRKPTREKRSEYHNPTLAKSRVTMLSLETSCFLTILAELLAVFNAEERSFTVARNSAEEQA
jgi:hypothetical protein